jgi:hypothetical protein
LCRRVSIFLEKLWLIFILQPLDNHRSPPLMLVPVVLQQGAARQLLYNVYIYRAAAFFSQNAVGGYCITIPQLHKQTYIMTTENSLYNGLEIVKQFVYDKCGFVLTNLELHPESIEYGACSFELDGHKVEHRVSKITPAKTGQFVTIWKRSKNGVIKPFDISDDFDFIAITSKSGGNMGQFIFPKSVLADRGIISGNGKDGKRGIRVYPKWDTVTSKQAEKTQTWQTKYFITTKNGNTTDINLALKIFNKTSKALPGCLPSSGNAVC